LRLKACGTHRILAVLIEDLHLCLRSLQETESLYVSVQTLSQGRLSHHLVHTAYFRQELYKAYARAQNMQPDLQLVREDMKYYYQEAVVHGAFYNDAGTKSLVVVVDVPLTRQFLAHPLSLYKVKTFELNSPDNQTYHTKLSRAPAYIAYDYRNHFYFVAENESDLPFPAPIKPWQMVNIHEPDVQLFSVRKLSSGMALIGGSFETIKRTCGYNIVFEELPPNVYRLSETKLLLNNIQELRVTRRGRDSIRALNETISIEAPQYIYEIPCESQIEVLGHVIFSYTEC